MHRGIGVSVLRMEETMRRIRGTVTAWRLSRTTSSAEWGTVDVIDLGVQLVSVNLRQRHHVSRHPSHILVDGTVQWRELD